MFKKAIKVASSNSLSGKDKKKLISDLSKTYDPDAVNALFEKNNANLVANKLQGSKIQIYLLDNIPLFVDATSKGDFFPSIYAIHLCPNLIQGIEINSGVDSFLMNGANLMWQGVKDPVSLGKFNKDDVRYAKTSDNKIIAIGAMACSSEELATKGATGTAMFVLTIVDDNLWAIGPKKVLPPLLTDSKKETAKPAGEGKAKEEVKKEEVKVDEIKGQKTKEKEEKGDKKKKQEEKEEDDEEEEEEEQEEDNGADDLAQYFGGMIKKKPTTGGTQKKSAPTKVAPKKQVVKKEEEFDSEDDEKKKKKAKKTKGKKKEEEDDEPKKDKQKDKKGKKQKESEEEEEESDEENEKDEEEKEKEEKRENKESGQGIPTKIVDEYLMEAFLTALKISLDEQDLPMEANEFYTKHLLPCKREGISLDIKKSSYQKMGKFLQSMAKLGIIEFKESKKGAGPQITKIHRENPKLADFEPAVSKTAQKEEEEEKEENDVEPKAQISEVFKIKPQIHQFFPEESHEKYFTKEEVQSVLQKYINSNSLMEKKMVQLDEKLKPLFWVDKPESEEENDQDHDQEEAKKEKKKQASFAITKDDLYKKLDDYLIPHYKIIDIKTKEQEIKPGTFKGMTLVAEKTHNKNVTIITGLEAFKFNIKSLVNKFQTLFECDVTTHNVKEKHETKEKHEPKEKHEAKEKHEVKEKHEGKGKHDSKEKGEAKEKQNPKEKHDEKLEVIVHGNFIDQIIEFFVEECKIDKNYINSTNKLKEKKKEKVFNI